MYSTEVATQWLKQIINESRVFQGGLVINAILMLGFVFGDRSPYKDFLPLQLQEAMLTEKQSLSTYLKTSYIN